MPRGIIVTSSNIIGLEPLYSYPPTLDEALVYNIAIKATTLVFSTVDPSIDFEGTSLLELPNKEITVLVYYFLYPQKENGAETQISTTISLFIESEFEWFFLREIEHLKQRIVRIVNKIRNTGNFVDEDFKELYNFLDSCCRTDETTQNKQHSSSPTLIKPVIISDQLGFLDYYPYISLDLREEIVSRLLDGDFTIEELSKNYSASSCETFPILQRLFRYKLIELQE
ncbi:MAG: hypothetical protein ACFFCD_00175 [Promethearchaeota archaeon]